MIRFLLFSACVLIATTNPLSAQFIPVTGTAAYDTATNWTSSTINGVFSSTLTGNLTATFAADFAQGGSENGLSFTNGGNFNITLQSAGTAARLFTLNGNITANPTGTAPRTITLGSTTAANGLNIALGASRIIDVNSTNILNLVNIVSGTGFSITKTNTGILQLSGENTYTGGTIINAGTLRVSGNLDTTTPAGLGTGAITLAGGTLDLRNNGTGTSQTIIFNNALTVTGNATWNVDRRSANSGSVIRLNSLSIGAFTLNVTGANTYSARINGTTTLTGNATFNPTTAGLNLVGLISGAGFGYTKTGTGTLTLNSNASTYTGITTLNGGTVSVGTVTNGGGNSSLGASAATAGNLVFNGGTLIVTGAGASSNRLFTLGSAGTITNNGTGAQNFTGTGAIAFTGGVAHTLTLNGTNANTSTFTPQITDDGAILTSLVKGGAGTWSIAGTTNTYTGGTQALAGNLLFTNAGAVGGSGANVTVAAGASVGTTYAIDQAFLDRITTASAGAAILGTSSTNPLDFSTFPALRLGATGVVTFGGTLTPNGTAYRFGGGGGTLNVQSLLSAPNTVNVGGNLTTTSFVILNNSANTHLSNAIDVISLSGLEGTNPGDPSPLGTVPAVPTDNFFVTNGGTYRYGNSTTVLHPNRVMNLGTGGGGLDTNGFTLTNSTTTFTGSGAFFKLGGGTLTLTNPLPSGAGLNVFNVGGTTANGLDLNGQTLTLGIVRIGGGTVALPTTVTNANLTITGAGSIIGQDASARLVVTDTLTVNTTGDFSVGQRITDAAAPFTATLDASTANAVSITAANFYLGRGLASSSGGANVGNVVFSSKPAATTTLTLSSGLHVGGNNVSNNFSTSALTFSAGANSLTTPVWTVGAGKVSGTVDIVAGGNLAVGGFSGGNTALTIADHNAAGTGGSITGVVNFTGGSVGDFAGNDPARFGAILIAVSPTSNTGSGATGTLTIAGANSFVTANSITLASARGTVVTASTAFLNLNGGVVQFNNAGTGITIGAGASTLSTRFATINLTAGVLDMNTKNITLATTTPATTFTFNYTGGTLRNLGTLNTGLTQTGGTFERTLAGTSTVQGAYALTNATVRNTVASGIITTTGGLTANAGSAVRGIGTLGGAVTLNNATAVLEPGIDPGFVQTGILNFTGALTLTAGVTTLELRGLTPGTDHDQITLASGGSVAYGGTLALTYSGSFNFANTDFITLLNNGNATGGSSGTFTGIVDGQVVQILDSNAVPAFEANIYYAGDAISMTTSGGNDLVLTNFVPVPEPALLGLAVLGLFAVRRRR